MRRLHGGEKTEAAYFHAEDWGLLAGDFAGDAEHGAVAAEDEQEVGPARERGGVRADRAAQAGELRGGGFGQDFAPAAPDELRGLLQEGAVRDFARVGDQPDPFDVVSQFFKQRQKFFVARRAEQRDSVTPCQCKVFLSRRILPTRAAHGRECPGR